MKKIKSMTDSDLCQSSFEQAFIDVGRENVDMWEYIVIHCHPVDEGEARKVEKILYEIDGTEGKEVGNILVFVYVSHIIPEHKWKMRFVGVHEIVADYYGAGFYE